MALDPAVGQLKLTTDRLPLEVSGREFLADLLLDHGCAGLRHAHAIFLLHLVGNDHVVETVETVGDGRVLLIYEPLLFSPESELVLLVRLHLDVRNTN